MGDVLNCMYSDSHNILYFAFLKSILSELQTAVKAFEGEQTIAQAIPGLYI